MNKKDKKRKASKKWYKNNKPLAIQRAKDYLAKLKVENPEKYSESNCKRQKKYSQTPKGIYRVIKQNSVKRKMPFLLSQKSFIEWYNSQKKSCYYCEIPETINGKRMSIDRKDNNLSYTIKNIVLACDNCNGVKSNILTEKEMLIVGKLIMKKKWKSQ